jgi:hypothetical protein
LTGKVALKYVYKGRSKAKQRQKTAEIFIY